MNCFYLHFPLSRAASEQTFNDPIHGHFGLEAECCKVIDTPQFQRLREVKQLGTTYYIFPGACHNRFEHSLGVSHLATQVVHNLSGTQKELGITRSDMRVVQLAGLCHDLGHAPFSHMFEYEFLPRVWNQEQMKLHSHEQMSADMLDFIIEENCIDDYTKDEVDRAKGMICSSLAGAGSSRGGGLGDGKGFLKEIVANGRSGVDVDKFDYLERDCHYAGIKASCNFSRLYTHMRVIGDEICYKASEAWNIYDLFQTRASLFKKVYQHRKGKAVEYMVVDALLEAEPVLKLTEKLAGGPREFQKLDDTILKRIEWGPEPELWKAQEIVKRLRTRDLYRYVDEYTVPEAELQSWPDVTPEEIVARQDTGKMGVDLRPEDVIVQNMKVDFGSKNKNPVDNVNFYSDYHSAQHKFSIAREHVSTLLPAVFMERRVRVYSRSRDQKTFDAIKFAFDEFKKESQKKFSSKHGLDIVLGTPERSVRPRIAAPRLPPTGRYSLFGDNA